MKIRSTILALLALAASSCESETFFKDNRKNLDAGLAALDGDPATAVRQAESIVMRTNEEAGTYALQRFFGAYLAAQAHLTAASRGAFLPDSPNRKAGGVRLSEGSATAAEQDLAVSHLVAAMYHSSLGLEWLPRAEKARPIEDGQPLLPEAFEKFGAVNAGISMLLSQIAIFSRLRFQDKVDVYLRDADHKELIEYSSCKTVVERVQLQPWLRAWLNYAVHDFLRQENPSEAYKFAVTAITLAEQTKGAFPRTKAEELERFVLANEKFQWLCPNCKTTSQPSEPRCVTCSQIETVAFRMSPK